MAEKERIGLIQKYLDILEEHYNITEYGYAVILGTVVNGEK